MLGVSFGFHDAAASFVEGDQIVFAAQSERYTKVKNDPWLAHLMIMEALEQHDVDLSVVSYYEDPILKGVRQWITGEPRPRFGVFEHIESTKGLRDRAIYTGFHHRSHAAAGFYTSPWTEASIIVVDSVGEFDCVSLWEGRGRHLKKVWSQWYPNSLGLLYSAFTQRLGLKPNEQEYIMMGMASYGRPIFYHNIINEFIRQRKLSGFSLTRSVHTGLGPLDWFSDEHDSGIDLAASIQKLTEDIIVNLFRFARKKTGMKNVCYQGGVALNCKANTRLIQDGAFDGYWIMPNPGDAGASLGAALDRTREFVEFKTPLLGSNIERVLDPVTVVNYLLTHGVAGIANGRAEFGPRAFGNRSLLADPRVPTMKNRVNSIKQREEFRPFAPIILEEHVDEYFTTYGADLRYMQYAVPCKKPDEIPATVHVDGSSRVQVVSPDSGNIYDVLKEWYRQTGCPVLLNTSLNIKGSPIVNDLYDAQRFEKEYDVKVF